MSVYVSIYMQQYATLRFDWSQLGMFTHNYSKFRTSKDGSTPMHFRLFPE